MKFEDIETLTYFQRNPGETARRLAKTKRPMVLTVKGKPGYVIQEPAAYERLVEEAQRARAEKERADELQYRLDTLKALKESEEELRSGAAGAIEEMYVNLEKRFPFLRAEGGEEEQAA